MTAADKKLSTPTLFCSKSVGMLLLFYAIMMLRNTAFAASEAVTTLPSALLAATSPYGGDIFVPQSMEGYTKEIIFGHDLGNGLPAKIYP